jgi:hypothetical protein
MEKKKIKKIKWKKKNNTILLLNWNKIIYT